MDSRILKVGIREFRAHLPQYLFSEEPIAIMRHGEMVGFYIPAHRPAHEAEIETLKQAALQLEKLLQMKGVAEEELISEYRLLRQGKK